jgi:type I restriction enzyme S subunit
MAKETSSTIFKNLVSSPVGIIAEFIINKIASESNYEPLRSYFLEIQTGKTPPMSNPEYYSSNDIEWIKPSDIGFEKHITATDWISNKAVNEKKATIYKPNTVLIICIGGGIGRLGIVDKICSSNQQITGILFTDDVLPEFAYYFFLSRYKIFEENSSKSTLPIINQKGLGNLDFICPSKSVQKEVVRFLNYCKDCLEGINYPTKTNFHLSNEIFEFSNKAFKAYFTQKTLLKEYKFQLTQIELLNQAILQEAVQGKLVKQNPGDEPASELLKRIKAEKAKSGKKEKPLPPIKPEEIPFEIPKNWVWCKLGEIALSISTGPFGTMLHQSDYVKNGIPLVNPMNIVNEKIVASNKMMISPTTLNRLKNYALKIGDVVIGRRGEMGRCAVVTENEDGWLCGTGSFFLRLHNEIYRPYFIKVLGSEFAKSFLLAGSVGATMNNLNHRILNNLTIPLPPLSEQTRIVAEIEKQLALTKQLKEHIIANQHATEQLLKALLHGAFEVETQE